MGTEYITQGLPSPFLVITGVLGVELELPPDTVCSPNCMYMKTYYEYTSSKVI